MTLRNKLIALSLISPLTLLGCSAPNIESETEVDSSSRAAGTLGSRICFLSWADQLISIRPSADVYQKNADHIVGSANSLTSDQQLCFAGWNSYERKFWVKVGNGNYRWKEDQVDVLLTLDVDGRYNSLFFAANNSSVGLPYAKWTDDMERQELWPSGGGLRVGQERRIDFADQKFRVTRLDDSEYYKEFLVTFLKRVPGDDN